MRNGYTTPEGFWLHRPLLLPDARSFADIMEYVCEWDIGRRDRPSEAAGATRYIPDVPTEPRHEWHTETGTNEIGPYCNVDLSQLDGLRSRSMVVRATDAVMQAVAPRIVTRDDHLSFKLIAHKSSRRVLVILDHSSIIGSHYLAYIDPATIPVYPFADRDAAVKRVCETIKAGGHEPMMLAHDAHHRRVQAFTRTAATNWQNVYHGDPINIDPEGNVS